MTIIQSCRLSIVVGLLLSNANVFAQAGSDPSLIKPSDSVHVGWLKSLTNDGIVDRVSHNVAPITWQYIREADVLWRKRVWREIDTREKQNVAFRYAGDENTGGGMFIEILIDALNRGKINAYKTMDDRFTTLMSKDDIRDITAGKADTEMVIDPVKNVETQVITHKDFNPTEITKYRIKEDWIFDRNEGQMVVRIVGLAPVIDLYKDNVLLGSKAMFWLYYPDVRGLLSQYEVYNPQNDVYRMTWDEFFESRQFSSKITKESNPFQNDFRDQRGSNPSASVESLYDSQHAAEEIFNKEHDMWVY